MRQFSGKITQKKSTIEANDDSNLIASGRMNESLMTLKKIEVKKLECQILSLIASENQLLEEIDQMREKEAERNAGRATTSGIESFEQTSDDELLQD